VRNFVSSDIGERTGSISFHGIVEIGFGKALCPNAEASIRAKDVRGTIEAHLGLLDCLVDRNPPACAGSACGEGSGHQSGRSKKKCESAGHAQIYRRLRIEVNPARNP